MMNRKTLACVALALAVASLPAQTLTPSLAFLPGTGGTAELRLTLSGATPSGVGFVFYAPALSGPFATPWGALHVTPPELLVAVPLTPTGTFVYPIPAAMPAFALALQGATYDPSTVAGRLVLTNYALIAYEPVGVTLPDPGAAGSWNDKTKQWCISAVGAPGSVVEVFVYEANPPHAISVFRGVIGRDGELNQCGNYPPGLRQGDKFVVKINGNQIIELR